jgi:hypothetical protein
VKALRTWTTSPDPDLLAKEIVKDPETALEQFTALQEALD